MKRRSVLLTVVVCLAAWQVACGGGGGGKISQPPPQTPAPTVTVSASPTKIASGNSSTLTITTSNATSCSMSSGGSSQSVTCNGTVKVSPSANTTYTVTATGDGGSATDSATVEVQLALTLSAPSSTNVDVNGTTNVAASVQGGDGQATVAWTANPAVGSFSPATGTSTTWTAPSSVTSSPETVTLTATATDGTGSMGQTATATVTVTVTRVITIGTSPSNEYPNNELYADFGEMIAGAYTCTGCAVGDTLNVQSTYGGDTTTTFAQGFSNPFEGFLNFVGPGYMPGLISFWITGTDGAKSNTLWLTFDGAQNEAVQDPSTGEIYYYNSGNGSTGSGKIMKFKPDGTADGTIAVGSGDEAPAFDGGLIYLTSPAPIASTENGIDVFDATNGTVANVVSLTNGEPGAISASGGLVCVTIPTGTSPNGTDAVDCNNNGGTFTLPDIPAGSQPAAIKVLDANDVVVYGRGDSTLRWYTISGTSGTTAGTLQLSQFTKTDSSYWKQYPATGGWGLTEVGTTLAVMGQVVNGDGTVSQKLALVDNTTQKLIQYVDLPAGTVHIAPDPTNGVVVAEYPDFTVSPPIRRFKWIYVDTGNSTDLGSTSTLVPGAGFLITKDGSKIVTCVEGKCDFQPNQ